MWEKTLRYPGHAEKMGLLRVLGFFDEEPVDVDGVHISPRRLSSGLLGRRLLLPGVKDIVAMRIEVSGVRSGKHVQYAYQLFDQYDERKGITAMARTTAYTASIISQLILRKAIKEKGVVAPEIIGMNDEIFSMFLKESRKRGIEITESEAHT
jgi:saccharopine dehydrogenase-like NADP-dependent oxidoreductase